MGDGLRVYFTAAHIFNGQGQSLPVLNIHISEVLEVGLLYLRVPGPDNLATAVHTQGRLFPTKLQGRGIQIGRVLKQ